jgi:O-antigen/teichoic acid export membrane protein
MLDRDDRPHLHPMRASIAKGAAWMVLFRLIDRSIGIVSTAILARLLLPADFGLVAMAMSIIAVIELASTFSFEMALIQKAEPSRRHYDTAWTLNIAAGTAGALGIVLATWPTAAFYGDERLVPIMLVLAAVWVVASFENVGTVNFRREMNFSAEFRLMFLRRLAGFAATMVAAAMLRNHWALIIGTVTTRVAGLLLSYAMHPYRPRWSLSHWRELFRFSAWLVVANMVGVLIGKLPHFAVGRMFGAASLGAYSVGAEIANLAYTELVAPINRAMFPGYSRLAGDPDAFRRTCLEATTVILAVVFPATVLVAILAAPIVRLLLGSQWSDAAPIIQLLAVSGAVSAVTSNNVAAYMALGRPRLISHLLLTRLAALLAGMLLLARPYGMAGVAAADVLASLACLVVSIPLLFRTVRIGVRAYWSCVWRPLVAAALAGVAAWSAVRGTVGSEGVVESVLTVAAASAIVALVYPLGYWLLWLGAGRPRTIELEVAVRGLAWLRGRLQRAA